MKHIPVFFILLLCRTAFAQPGAATLQDATGTGNDTTFIATATPPNVKKSAPEVAYPKNVVKMNVTSLLFKNYNFVLERSLTPKISASVGYRAMPSTKMSGMPALKKGYKLAGEDKNTLEEDWSDITASNKAVTAEARFYSGRKPGPRGFYAGLYGRYTKFDIGYDYVYETTSKNYLIPVKTTTQGIGGGLYIGVQWLIGKRVALDWQILGGHWGKLTGNGTGTADLSSLSTQDKENIKDDIEYDIISAGEKNIITANVTNTGVKVKVDGPFAGLRSGISIGISF